MPPRVPLFLCRKNTRGSGASNSGSTEGSLAGVPGLGHTYPPLCPSIKRRAVWVVPPGDSRLRVASHDVLTLLDSED